MATVEERIFREERKPTIYMRYIDDIFTTTKGEGDLEKIQEKLQENSVLKFTTEPSRNKCLPFLDTLVTKENEKFVTTVYTKPTNVGRCLNAKGECPETYKKSVISAYVKLALTHCSTWRLVNAELDRIRQLLTNNGFRGDMIEEGIRKQMEIFHKEEEKAIRNDKEVIIYHKMSYNNSFKQEADALQNICKRGIKTTEPEGRLSLRIYCKPHLLSTLVMKNNTAPSETKETMTNIVYRFKCTEGTCESSENFYIGYTTNQLRKRLQFHRNQGSIFQHFTEKHNRRPTVTELLSSTDIITREQNFTRLTIAEAVHIQLEKPTLNVQTHSHHVLPSTRRRRALDIEALLQMARNRPTEGRTSD